jgi:hypothetical protein
LKQHLATAEVKISGIPDVVGTSSGKSVDKKGSR